MARLDDPQALAVLRLLVAVERPVPVELIGAVASLADLDLPSALSHLEIERMVAWHDDDSLEATDAGRSIAPLSRAERAGLRGEAGRAAHTTSLDAGTVAEWLLDGCRVQPDPSVVPWLLERADRLMRTGELEQSAAVLSAVVAAVERGQPADELDRIRASLALGFTLRWLERSDEADRLGRRAVELARASSDPVALATAALAWRPDSIAVSDDPAGVALIDHALEAVGDAHDALRYRLLAARAEAVLFIDLEAARAAAIEALAIGRRVGEPDGLLRAAYAHRIAHWHPARQAETLALAAEMVAVASRAADLAEHGALTRLQVFLELGDWPHVDGELAAMGRRLTDAPRPMHVLWYQVIAAARAQAQGRWDDTERLVAASLRLAVGPEYGAAFQLLLTQRVLTSWQRGDDLVALVGADLLPAGPMRTSWEACLLGWTCERRDPTDVEAALDALLADGMASIRPDLTFGPVASSLAMAAAFVGSARHANVLFEGLLPYADQWAGTGGAVVNGPYALHLGRLAATLGRAEDAERLLDAAARSAAAGGCRPWEARIDLARAVHAATAPARRTYSRRAAAVADDLGMADVARAARVLAGDDALPAGLTDREAEVLRLLATGATNADIAGQLYLSVKTVERHLVNAYRKAGVRNRAEAAAFALRELQV